MKYRNMARYMSEKEIKEALQIIYPDTLYKGYRRTDNEIIVFFSVNGKNKECTLLSDLVEDLPKGMELSPNEQFEYRKYMVAKGYSELWINNQYGKKKRNVDNVCKRKIFFETLILMKLVDVWGKTLLKIQWEK